MPNYFFWTFGGKNGLKGSASIVVELKDGRAILQKDPDNPAVLEDVYILNALQTSRSARADFCLLFPDLDDASQLRLTDLVLTHKRESALLRGDQDFADAIQHQDVTSGVRTRLERALRT